jgi:hypothetical protein
VHDPGQQGERGRRGHAEQRGEQDHEEGLAGPDAGRGDHDHDADGVRQREGAAERGGVRFGGSCARSALNPDNGDP